MSLNKHASLILYTALLGTLLTFCICLAYFAQYLVPHTIVKDTRIATQQVPSSIHIIDHGIYAYLLHQQPKIAFGDILRKDLESNEVTDIRHVMTTIGATIESQAATKDNVFFLALNVRSLTEIAQSARSEKDEAADTYYWNGAIQIFMYDFTTNIMKRIASVDQQVMRDGAKFDFSPDERMVLITPFICIEFCFDANSPTFVYSRIEQKATDIGTVADFEWTSDGGYRYKKYVRRTCTPQEVEAAKEGPIPDAPCFVDNERVPWITVKS